MSHILPTLKVIQEFMYSKYIQNLRAVPAKETVIKLAFITALQS